MTNKRLLRMSWALGVAAAVLGVASADAAQSGSGSLGGDSFRIEEVGLGQQAFVALKNVSAVRGTLKGLSLCQGGRCYALPGTTVKPARTVRISTGNGAGLTNVIARRATFGKLLSRDGEIALYGSRSVNDPKAMRGYVQWGTPKHALTPVAIKAGL